MKHLAILGGEPAFPEPVPFARPATPPLERVMERLRPSYERGMLTNGPLVRSLEEQAAERLGARHVVAVASCTSGLMLTLQALKPRARAVVPSFTFSATAHAAVWAGLEPLFVECDPDSFHIDTADAARRAEGHDVSAILATHVFGAPCPIEAVEALGQRLEAPIVFDAAHGFGALRNGRPVGSFGTAEVFSLSPTKPVVAGEGGLVATDDEALAEVLRIGRDYGNPGDYDSRFAGINARMSELHAALGLESLATVEETTSVRQELAAAYGRALADVPGLALQRVADGDRSTYKDFTVAIKPTFGLARDVVVKALSLEGIDTRCYFSPPVHRHQAYAHLGPFDLPVTEEAAGQVISLPMFNSLPESSIARIADVIATLQANAAEVTAASR